MHYLCIILKYAIFVHNLDFKHPKQSIDMILHSINLLCVKNLKLFRIINTNSQQSFTFIYADNV